jgi:nucleoside phosphorylase
MLLHCGVGETRALQALQWLDQKPFVETHGIQPSCIISAGFCGALDDNMQIGDLVVPAKVVDTRGKSFPITWAPRQSDSLPEPKGRLLTTTRLIGDPNQKKVLRESFNAVAIDMESATIGHYCQERDIAFGCVRVVSDRFAITLSPDLVSLLSGERVSPGAVLRYLFLNPSLALTFMRLARDSSRAAHALSQGLLAAL